MSVYPPYISLYMVTRLLASRPPWSRPPFPSPVSGCAWGLGWTLGWVWCGWGLPSPSVGVVGVGCGDESRYLPGSNRIIYRCVDVEMDYHSYAAYAVFLRFSECLRRTHRPSWWNIRSAQIPNSTTAPRIVPQTGPSLYLSA